MLLDNNHRAMRVTIHGPTQLLLIFHEGQYQESQTYKTHFNGHLNTPVCPYQLTKRYFTSLKHEIKHVTKNNL